MPKRRTRLLPISLTCIAGLALGVPLLRWKGAPWNRPLAQPVMTVTARHWPEYLAFSPDSSKITVLEPDVSLQRWGLDGLEVPMTAAPEDVLSPDGGEMARVVVRILGSGALCPLRSLPSGISVSYRPHHVDLVDSATGALRWRLPANWLPSRLRTTYAPGGGVLFLDGFVQFFDGPRGISQLVTAWDRRRGRLLWSHYMDREHPVSMNDAALAPDGRVFALRRTPSGRGPNFPDGPVKMQDIRTGANLFQAAKESTGWSTWTCTATSPRGSLFAAKTSFGFADGTSPLYVWDMKRRGPAWSWPRPGGVTNIAFSPDERLLAISTLDRDEVVIVNARTGRRLAVLNETTPLIRFQQRVHQRRMRFQERVPQLFGRLRTQEYRAVPEKLAWSPNGRNLAVAYSDKTVKVWRVPRPMNNDNRLPPSPN